MAQESGPWENNGTGDGQAYSSDEWSEIWEKLFIQDPTEYGVIRSFDGSNNELVGTETAPNTFTVQDGWALVRGKWLHNDSTEDFNIPTSGHVAGRYYRVVAEVNYLASFVDPQTVRLTLLTGVEGGGIPSLTQIAGVTWDVPLWTIHISNGGVMTLTDDRVFVQLSSAMPEVDNSTIEYNGSDQLRVKDAGITLAKLAAAVQALLFKRADYELSDSVVSSVNWTLPANTSYNDVDSMTITKTTTVVCDWVVFFSCSFDDQITTANHCRYKFVLDAVDSEVYNNTGDTPRDTMETLHTVYESVAAGAHTIKVQFQRDNANPAGTHMVARRLTLLIRPKAI